MKIIFSILLTLFALPILAQGNSEMLAVKAVIDQLFECMRSADTIKLEKLFDSSARLQTVMVNAEGKPELRNETISNFISSVGAPRTFVYDEKIWSYDIRIDGNLCTAWTEYSFFLGDRLNHCGVNAFHLFKNSDGNWKISQITDTRRKSGCATEQPNEIANIGTVLDKWHLAAATADEDTFFGSMTSEAIYLGTDAGERWLRDEMKDWAKPYFDRESAWAFTSFNRKIYFSENETTAWFEELLNTWMGVCRGSGVLIKTEHGWKIAQYNLALTVPNDLINGFIELVNKAPRK